MPELPEVETIVRRLRQGTEDSPGLLESTVSATHLYWKKSLENSSEDELEQRLAGQTLKEITRRGKFSIFSFGPEYLIFHLRMSGELRSETLPEGADFSSLAVGKHTRFTLEFTNRKRMVFDDPRKFGRLWLTDDPQKVVGGLGPEPFDPDLTAEGFHQALLQRKRQLKPLLLDQSFLAGLGNIYSDESLFLARLHPLQLTNQLSLAQADTLLKAIRQVLQHAIEKQGSSIDWVYRHGEFQNTFNVYQRTGEPCTVCGTPITRIVVGQRGTHFCPHCQKIVNQT